MPQEAGNRGVAADALTGAAEPYRMDIRKAARWRRAWRATAADSKWVVMGRMVECSVTAMVKLILRDKQFEVKPGMTLLSAMEKVDILPESVIATREGEMILEDEILKDGQVIKLVAVISGG